MGNGQDPDPAGFGQPAALPGAADLGAARGVAERYLAAWGRGQEAAMLALTSPLAPDYAKGAAEFHGKHAARTDEGACPLPSSATGAAAALQPVTELTRWETEWLAEYAGSLSQFASLGGGRPTQPADFPRVYARRGDLLFFRY